MDKGDHLEEGPPQHEPKGHEAHGTSLAEAVKADHPVEDDRTHAKQSDPAFGGTRQGGAASPRAQQ